MVSSAEYLQMLKRLLPPGIAFPRQDVTSVWALLLECWAIELSRIDSRLDALVREDDPRISLECFTKWLEEWGEPDLCAGLVTGLNDTILRQLLLFKITTVGGQSRQFFADLAARFGYRIQIDELQRYTVQSQVMDALWSEPKPFWWRVNILSGTSAEGSTVSAHTVIGGVNEALAWWGDQLIECLIERYKPAHSEVIYGYFDVRN